MPRSIGSGSENDTIRQRFFSLVFGERQGVLCLATKHKDGHFSEIFFHYPDDMEKMLAWINRNLVSRNMYFCAQLLTKAKRIKPNVSICTNIWSDLDEANPNGVKIPPSITLQTSNGRWQGFWLLSEPVAPEIGERAARKLAYSFGADTSGWDLTQLLRVPITYNIKYEDTIVEISEWNPERVYDISEFDKLSDRPEFEKVTEFPEKKIASYDPEKLLEKYRGRLLPNIYKWFTESPGEDWSSVLWSMESQLLEAGLTPEEVFSICWNSAANKYARDDRSQYELWQEIQKAKIAYELKTIEPEEEPIHLDSLLSEEEWKIVNKLPKTFVEKYIEWASRRSDASPEYHQAGAFTILSCLLAESVILPTSWGNVVPNLWFMILGDTTLTRKTTAMNMAMELLFMVYEDCMLATDGSYEGMLSAMSLRSGRTSLFWRDEFAGMLDAMKRRDYHAGMIEFLTKLYDGTYQRRTLRKELIEVRDPVFVMLCGGIKSRVIELFDPDYVINGFIPRFIYIIAEPDISKLRPMGPPTDELQAVSADLLKLLLEVRQKYDKKSFVMLGAEKVESNLNTKARLTPDAWARYNRLDSQMTEAGDKSDNKELYTPTMGRLAISTLKCAILLAALRDQGDEVVVEVEDILRAAKYADSWKDHAISVVEGSGKSMSEKTLDRAYGIIASGKNSRSHLMRAMHLSSREADLILDTLEQRSLIVRTKEGKLERLYPAFGGNR